MHAHIHMYTPLHCCMQDSKISASLWAVAEGYFCMLAAWEK